MELQPGRNVRWVSAMGCAILMAGFVLTNGLGAAEPVREIRVGIIGLDTSHAVAFAKELNNKDAKDDVAHCRVVAAYPKGSPDIESSVTRVPDYIKEMKKLDVEIVDSIETLLTKVDAILLETNDGRPHFEQALPVFKAKKPMFIDKPVAGSLSDAIALFMVAEKTGVPMFSASSLRYAPGVQQIRGGAVGKVLGCDSYSPCHLEKTHPDFFWYGVHGVESLFTCMGTGCQSVSRTSAADFELAVGVWDGGRVGTFRGIHAGRQTYGGTAFGEKGLMQLGDYGGYRPLVVEIVKFFRTGVSPIVPAETIEIFAFMEAADESKRQGGKPVTIESVMSKARKEAEEKVAKAGF